jgi:hypothetical protein
MIRYNVSSYLDDHHILLFELMLGDWRARNFSPGPNAMFIR